MRSKFVITFISDTVKYANKAANIAVASAPYKSKVVLLINPGEVVIL